MKRVLSLILVLTVSLLSSCSGPEKDVSINDGMPYSIEETKNNTVSYSIEETKVEIINNIASSVKPVVYFTKDITADSLVKIYDKLGWTPTGKSWS